MHYKVCWGAIGLAMLAPAFPPAVAAPRSPVERYRTNTIDPRARSVPAEIRQGVFAEPDRYLGPLVRFLVEGAENEFHKIKRLHDWVADNISYDVESYLAGEKVVSPWQSTLRRRRSVCYGYAALLAEMCRLAGIPCEKISGYGRGYGFGIGRAESIHDVNHAWNAVRLEGVWYLVDVTWDAGHIRERSFRKAYGTAYLFLEPRQFLYTHFPAEPRWQLLDPPRRTLVQREAGRGQVLVTFPQAGRWSVYLHSHRRDEPGEWLLAASLEFEATAGTTKTFPKTFGSYDSLDGCLYSPLFVPLPTGRPLSFRIRVRGTDEVNLAIGKTPWQPLVPETPGGQVYRITASVPPGVPVKITAKRPVGDHPYWTLVDFTPGTE